MLLIIWELLQLQNKTRKENNPFYFSSGNDFSIFNSYPTTENKNTSGNSIKWFIFDNLCKHKDTQFKENNGTEIVCDAMFVGII